MKKSILLAAVVLTVGFFSSCVPDPEACFTVSSESIDNGSNPIVGEKISFLNCSVEADSYFWDFGDDEGTSTQADPKYTYQEGGEYTVTLEATNKKGTVTMTFDIEVLSLSGGWEGNMTLVDSNFDIVFDLDQQGEQLEGMYADEWVEGELYSSSVEDYEVSMKFDTEEYDSETATYTTWSWILEGEINDDYDEMSGTYKIKIDGTTYTDDSFVWEVSKTSSKSSMVKINKNNLTSRPGIKSFKF